MRRRRATVHRARGVGRSFLVVFLVLLAGACGEQSNVDPGASVSVRGSVRDADGSPLASRPVRLGSGVSVAEGGFGFLTTGLFCLSGECSGDFFDTTTDEDGRFRFDLTGRDTQSAFGEASSFLLSASAEPSGDRPTGPAVSARFRVQSADLELPTLDLVDSSPRLDSADGDVVATWDGTVAPAPYVVGFANRDSLAVWQVDAVEPSSRIDGRVLEDVAGLATVSAARSDEIEGSDLMIAWRSSSVAFRGGFGPPPSRGVGCELHGTGGSIETLEDCGVTDGGFARAGLPGVVCPDASAETSDTACETASKVRVVLPEPLPADLVVVRGCVDPCRVAVVRDGGDTSSDLGPVSAQFGSVRLNGAPAVAIDITTNAVSELAEVSVWTPGAGPSLLPADDPASLVPNGDDGGRGWDRTVVIAAGLLHLLVSVSVGIAIGRRSATTPSGGG